LFSLDVSVLAMTRMQALWEVIIPILFGLWFFAVARSSAASAVKWHSRLWGFSGTHRQYLIAFRVAGIGMVLFGLWIFLIYIAGASLDQSIKQLPARHCLNVAYSAYSQASDLGNGIVFYAVLGVGAAC